jgi:hypothetical protein
MSAYAYEVQGLYNSKTYGWEAVFTASTREEAISILKDYRESERVPFRIKRVKEEARA